MSIEFRGTTICAVRKDGKIAVAGDGQVTMGQNVVFKNNARKVRRIYHDQVVVGFAGAVADAFSMCDRFEEKLTQCGGNLERAAVALAQLWRGDQAMRQLDSMMIVADKENLLVLSGNGEVIDPTRAWWPSAPAAIMPWRRPGRWCRTPICPPMKSRRRRCISPRPSACSPITMSSLRTCKEGRPWQN